MILIAVVALGMMFGMPYLMDNSMFALSLPPDPFRFRSPQTYSDG